MAAPARKVLVVDDNRLYREAIRRNLEFGDYRVFEAEDSRSALEEIRLQHPQVVITDLDMTHRTEGLDLIREIKVRYPMLPVILVSAVGTFEEGAQARDLGAIAVISKSSIDEELEHLYDCLDRVFDKTRLLHQIKTRLDQLIENFDASAATELEEEINQALADAQLDRAIQGELFDWLIRLKDKVQSLNREQVTVVQQEALGDFESPSWLPELEAEVGSLAAYDEETRAMFLAAEHLLRQIGDERDVGLARNAGFSYSFAVENEIKQKLGRKIGRFFGAEELQRLLPVMYDNSIQNLALGFSRYVLLNRVITQEMTMDLIRQVLERIARHQSKYKADGLKALGVIVYVFGRDYSFEAMSGPIRVSNPLGLQGLNEDEICRLALLLVRLQHTRNPYIHPEFSEREKLTEMRRVVVETLQLVSKLSD